MRLTTGHEIHIVDGVGRYYRARVSRIEGGRVEATILESRQDVGEPPYRLTLGVGLIRNTGRFESLLEKAVELGASRIVPLETSRTQKKSFNRDRCVRVMTAGLKQALRSRLPELTDVQTFATLIEDPANPGLKMLAHESMGSDASMIHLADDIRRSEDMTVLVGPEGGFSPDEIEAAERFGWRIVSLGHARMRAETAALAAAAAIQMIKFTDGSDRTPDRDRATP
jgi:16S rRNA (uracil1498-N3)-methyltransferase